MLQRVVRSVTNEDLAVTPDQLRREAESTERLSRLVSYHPDKAWLNAKAAELRRLADRIEARSWLPRDRGEDPAFAPRQ
jgi:hypothetical protein